MSINFTRQLAQYLIFSACGIIFIGKYTFFQEMLGQNIKAEPAAQKSASPFSRIHMLHTVIMQETRRNPVEIPREIGRYVPKSVG